MNEMCELNSQGCCDFCVTGGVQGQNHHGSLLWRLASFAGGWEKKKMGKQCSGHHMLVGKNPRQAPAPVWKQTTEPCCTSPLPFHAPLCSKAYGRDILENPMIKHQLKTSGIIPNREVTSHLRHSQNLHRNTTGIIFKTSPNLPHCYCLCTRLIKI